ncbi:hypothetical protein D3C83_12260 [compost metagenome]
MIGGKPHFAHDIALHDPGEELLRVGVVQEQRAALHVERLGHDVHQAGKQHVQRQRVRNPVGNVDQRGGAAHELRDPDEQLGFFRIG